MIGITNVYIYEVAGNISLKIKNIRLMIPFILNITSINMIIYLIGIDFI